VDHVEIFRLLGHAINNNSRKGSKRNILAHYYDLGNKMYRAFLDPTMMYSSAIYPNGSSTLGLWEFYFCYCEGGFHERSISVVHLLASRPSNRAGAVHR